MIKINLLKPEKKDVPAGGTTVSVIDESRESKLSVPALIGAIAITVGTIGLLYFLQINNLNSEKKLLEERTLRKAELEKVLQKLAEIEATKMELDRKIKIINDLKFKQKDAVFMMDKLSRCLPDWVWLTDLTFKSGALQPQRQGAFQQPDRRSDQQPADFEFLHQCQAEIIIPEQGGRD